MKVLDFEPRHAPLAPPAKFRARVFGAAVASQALVAVTLAVGMVGFHWIEDLGWLDAFHQSAMLLSGMGPVATMATPAGKLFDGVYALFCGIVLLAVTAILFAPIIHRIMHQFHVENGGK